MREIQWLRIRTHHFSQRHAFEELCCQLASREFAPLGARFIRVAAPDGGVEAYHILPDGDEWGWQAKFFPAQLAKTQWQDIDGSVRRALETHPRLVQYTICVPQDLADPRKPGMTHAKEQWDKYVADWLKLARSRAKPVDFHFWGDHALTVRLTKDEHRGRRYYWFSEQEFSPNWFHGLAKNTECDAGERYTPELHVDLPIAGLFEGLGRTALFETSPRKAMGEFSRAIAALQHLEPPVSAVETLAQSLTNAGELLSLLKATQFRGVAPIRCEEMARLAGEFRQHAWELQTQLLDADYVLEQEARAAHRDGRFLYTPRYGNARVSLTKALDAVIKIQGFALGEPARLANMPALLLTGPAGSGKTHLFTDVALNWTHRGLPSVIFLGEWFIEGDPFDQMTKRLGLLCERREFLGALDAAAEASGSRALILIDGLNEGIGKSYWPKYLGGMLEELRRDYPRIGIGISIRSTYESELIKDHFRAMLVRAVHSGFAMVQYYALRRYFKAYGLKLPSAPLLNPEFDNPLFLKLFCAGLKNAGLFEVPSGYQGFTSIFAFLIDSVDKRLKETERIGALPGDNVVSRCLLAFAERMSTGTRRWLTMQEAFELSRQIYPETHYPRSLLRCLLVEGLISQEVQAVDEHHREEAIRFAYERFGDHCIVKYLLDTYANAEQLRAAFRPGGAIHAMFSTNILSFYNRGLLEALAIQLPERFGLELPDVMLHNPRDWELAALFFQSLLWRNPNSVSGRTLHWMRRFSKFHREHAFEMLLTLATIPDHPYNAEFLHRNLLRHPMPERDAWWSSWLRYAGEEGYAVSRLLDWSCTSESMEHIDDKPILLASIALAWLLSSTNRPLRDRATKSLVRLLTPRPRIFEGLLSTFAEVDDPYIIERLYAAAYGVAMRCQDDSALTTLACIVYRHFFEAREAMPHVLARDYARGVIEAALCRHISLPFDVARSRPPYGSCWIEEPPAREILSGRLEWRDDMSPAERAEKNITDRFGEHNIVDRWAGGPEMRSVPFSEQRFDQPIVLPEERLRLFTDTLVEAQIKSWQVLTEAIAGLAKLADGRFGATTHESLPGHNENENDGRDQNGEVEAATSLILTDLGIVESMYPSSCEVESDAIEDKIEDCESGDKTPPGSVELEDAVGYGQSSDLEKLLEILADDELAALVRDSDVRRRRLLPAYEGTAEAAIQEFRESASPSQKAELDAFVLSHLVSPHGSVPRRINGELVQRWVCQHALDLGWTRERFGGYDGSIGLERERGRELGVDTFGAKYLWMGYHEILARLSDNFCMHQEWNVREGESYHGPWQLSCRDIDPSFLVLASEQEAADSDETRSPIAWWSSLPYEPDSPRFSDAEWTRTREDLPDLSQLLNTHDGSGGEWVSLCLSPSWEQAIPPEQERFGSSRRRLALQVVGYFVRTEHVDKMFSWLLRQDYWNHWMPSPGDVHGIFLGELYSFPAWEEGRYDEEENGWATGSRCMPHPILKLSDRFVPSENDAAAARRGCCIPCSWLVREGGLRWSGDAGRWLDSRGHLVMQDPSIEQDGPAALLVRRDFLEPLLRRSGCELVWTVLGEKCILSHQPKHGRLRINGAYRYGDGVGRGDIWTDFESWEHDE